MRRSPFMFAPDEGGGGLPEKVKVGNEELTREEALERLSNYDRLQSNFTQATQKVSELSGRLDEQGRQIASLRTRPVERAGNEPDFDALHLTLDKEEAGLDPMADDYKVQRERVVDRRAVLRKQEREHLLAQVDARVKASESRSVTTASMQDRQAEVDRNNRQLFADAMKDPEITMGVPITEAERAQLWDAYESHVGKSFGAWHADLGKFEYNRAAVEGAIMDVPSLRKKVQVKLLAQGRDEGLRMHSRGAEAAESAPGTSAPPPDGSEHYADTALWLRQQPEDVRAHYLDTHKPFGEWYLKDRQSYMRRHEVATPRR